jgi:BirA family transcriptional regulator, biotin operon repressor / biotin---[acetyl-CoA-carboxylase] ligase
LVSFDVRHYESLGSTNDEAMRLAREGAADGTVVHADEQTAGRGRFARRWSSPPGNLYLSIVLRPDPPLSRWPEIGFIAALAVADAVEGMLPNQLRATLKWPNDVLLPDGKVAGILLEHAEDALILGVGINVLEAPPGTPASTIVGSGGIASVDGMRGKLLTALASWFDVWQQDGFPPIRAAWLSRAHPAGTKLRLTLGDRVVEGGFSDIDEAGALIIDTDEGRQRYTAGDVAAV